MKTKEEKAAAKRIWYSKNKEIAQKYYQENAEAYKTAARAYYAEHKEEIKAKQRAYYHEHKAEKKAYYERRKLKNG